MISCPTLLIAAMNPRPCGHWVDPTKECTDSLAQVMRYQNRIGGPLLDRIDIHVDVPRVDYEKLSSDRMASNRRRSVSEWNKRASGSAYGLLGQIYNAMETWDPAR